jgi:hypothetical protein
MKQKRIVAIALCCICLFGSVQAFASAAEPSGAPPGIGLRWSNLWNIALSMSYSGSEVNWVGQIAGNPGTESISATYTLQRLESNGRYTFIGSWYDSTASSEVLISSGSATTPKGTYKLSVAALVQNSEGSYETATNSFTKTFN